MGGWGMTMGTGFPSLREENDEREEGNDDGNWIPLLAEGNDNRRILFLPSFYLIIIWFEL